MGRASASDRRAQCEGPARHVLAIAAGLFVVAAGAATAAAQTPPPLADWTPVIVDTDRVISFAPDAHGFVWAATETDIVRLDGSSAVEFALDSADTRDLVPGASRGVWATGDPITFIDPWRGPSRGGLDATHLAIVSESLAVGADDEELFTFDPSNPVVRLSTIVDGVEPDWMVRGGDGLVYVGAGSTVLRIDPETGDHHQIEMPEATLGATARTSGEGGVWIVFRNEVAHLGPDTDEPTTEATTSEPLAGGAVVDDDGRIWVGTQFGQVIAVDRLDEPQTVAGERISPVDQLASDSAGNLWALEHDGSLHLRTREPAELTTILPIDADGDEVRSRVTTLVEFEGELLFAADGVGALVYDPTTAEVRRPGPAEVQAVDAIVAEADARAPPAGSAADAVIAAAGAITGWDVAVAARHQTSDKWWLGTADGLLLYDADIGAVVRHLDTADGMASARFAPSDAVVIDEVTYLATYAGVAVVPPTAPRLDLYVPAVVAGCVSGCTGATIGDAVTFGFAAIDQRSRSDIRMRYRLVDQDPGDWIVAAADQRTATFTDLEAGTYTFEVQLLGLDGLVIASNSPGSGSGDGTASVSVSGSVWSRAWAAWTVALAVIGSAIAVALALWRLRSRTARQIEREVGAQTEELAQARLEAEASNRAKTHLMATVSHDVRSSLMGMMGYADLIRLQPDSNTVGTWSTRILDSGRQAELLVSDLSDATAIESGQLHVTPTSTDAAGVVEAVAGAVQASASGAGFELSASIDDRVAARYLVDGRRLRQVLNNLTTNAVKYSDGPTVELGVHVLPGADESHRDRLRFSVRDDGPGPDPADIERIFEPYQRASPHRAHGVGLGLTVTRAVVELLGGRIEVDANPPGPCTFSFDLDLAPIHPERRVPRERRGNPVCVVAHDPTVADEITDAIREFGVAVVTVDSPRRLPEAIDASAAAAIVTEIELGRSSGRQLARDLRADARFAHLPVVGVARSGGGSRVEVDFDFVLEQSGGPAAIHRTLTALGVVPASRVVARAGARTRGTHG